MPHQEKLLREPESPQKNARYVVLKGQKNFYDPLKPVFWTIHEGYPEKFIKSKILSKIEIYWLLGHFFWKFAQNFLKRRLRRRILGASPPKFPPNPKILRGQVCLIQAIMGATAPLAPVKPVPSFEVSLNRGYLCPGHGYRSRRDTNVHSEKLEPKSESISKIFLIFH